MKTILKLSLVLLAAMTSVSTYAIDGADFTLKVRNSETKEISFAVNQIQKANVTITDKFHNIIYSEVATGKDGILKTYSLEEFPEGTYFLEVESNSKKVTHEITVSRKATTLSIKSVTVI
jgi:hypothetical protein